MKILKKVFLLSVAVISMAAGVQLYDAATTKQNYSNGEQQIASAANASQGSGAVGLIDAFDPNFSKMQAEIANASPTYRPPPGAWERVKCFFGDEKPCDRTPVWPKVAAPSIVIDPLVLPQRALDNNTHPAEQSRDTQ